MNGMKEWDNVKVVDTAFIRNHGDYKFVFCPYVPVGRFSQALDTFLYTFVWVIAGELSFAAAFGIALTKYVFKVIIALIDTIFIYWVRKW